MKAVDVSVVIPVYNAEKYIRKSLSSIMGQKLNNIEIICVDDGSTDNSRKILESYQKKDSRIRIISQENKGAGAARNNGLLHAKGDYVIFWDADDLFHKNALALMVKKCRRMKSDICICAATQFDELYSRQEVKGFLNTDYLPAKDPFNKYDIPETIFNFAGNVVWNKLYSRKFVEKHRLKFQEIPQANDTAFVISSMYFADRITYVNDRLISYRINNPQSLTGKASNTKYCLYESYCEAYDRLKIEKDFGLIQKSFQNKCLEGMYRSLNILEDYSDYKEIYEFLRTEGLAHFGIQNLKEEEFLKEWMYEDYQTLISKEPEQFLLEKAKSRLVERDHLKFILNRVRRRLAFFFKISKMLK